MGDVKIQRGGINKKVKAQGFKPTQDVSLYTSIIIMLCTLAL